MKKLVLAVLAVGLTAPALAQAPNQDSATAAAQATPAITGQANAPATPGNRDGAAVQTRRGVACVPPTATGGTNTAVTDPCRGMPNAATDNHTVPVTPPNQQAGPARP